MIRRHLYTGFSSTVLYTGNHPVVSFRRNPTRCNAVCDPLKAGANRTSENMGGMTARAVASAGGHGRASLTRVRACHAG